MWVNQIEGILAMDPPTNEIEKVPMVSIYVEGDVYDFGGPRKLVGYP